MYGVIIAEDEILVRIGLKNMINWNKLCMQVIADVTNGKEALEAYIKHNPDIIITDLRMPVMDGLSLIREIRKRDRHVRIIILTCLDEFSLAQEALGLGVSNYFLKLTTGVEAIEQVLLKMKEDMDGDKQNLLKNPWIDNSLLKEQILNDFVFYKTLPDDVFANLINRINLRLSEEKLCLVIMRLRDYNKLTECYKDTHGRKIRKLILDILENIFKNYNYGEAYCDYKAEYIILFSFVGLSEEQANSKLNDILLTIKDDIIRYFGVEAHFGISGMTDSYKQLPAMRIEALDVLDNSNDSTLPLKAKAALDYLYIHYLENVSLQVVADSLNITPNYLSHLFYKYLDVSFIDKLTEIRIEKAKKLLDNPVSVIYKVGEQVGYTNSTYFNRVFKKKTGLTPNEYKNRLQDVMEE